MWQVQMQFIPQNDMIWIAQLNPGDPIYNYDNEHDAWTQALTMEAGDASGRQYKAVQVG